jgi:uncharacterized protein
VNLVYNRYHEDVGSSHATIRFHAGLNDHLGADQREMTLDKRFFVPGSVKDLVESFGVPHPEVELILANGEPVPFSYVVRDGDRIDVYPTLELHHSGLRLRPEFSGVARFVLDVHLGRLAAYLRMLGFDTLYRNCFTDEQLVGICSEQGRILLTRDRGLLMHNAVVFGYLLRETDSHRQLSEIVSHFRLAPSIRPFTRCMGCNGILVDVAKEKLADQLPARTAELYDDFRQCPQCRKIYWKGSHYRRMLTWVRELTLDHGHGP